MPEISLLLLLACIGDVAPEDDASSAESSPQVADTATSATSTSTDSTPAEDSGSSGTGSTSTDSTDTGSTDTGSTSTAAAELEWVEVPVVCGDPEARAEAWFDHVDLRASEVAWPYGLQSGGLVVADLDDDPQLEILRASNTVIDRYDLESDGSWTATRLDVVPRVWMGLSVADIDGDHDLDVLLLGFDAPNALLRNEGPAGFVDVSGASGLVLEPERSSSAAWADWDGDGVLDLAIGKYGSPPVTGDNAHPSELYRGRGDGTFEDVSELLSGGLEGAYTFHVGWFDLTGDGRPDLIAANDFPGVRQTQVLYNREEGFEVDGGTGLGAGLDAMGLGVSDLNGDGLPDMAITSIDDFGIYGSVAAPDSVLYVDWAPALGMSALDRIFSWGVGFADTDSDGDEDLYMVFGDWAALEDLLADPMPMVDSLWEQDGPAVWVDRARERGLDDDRTGRGLALVDVDRDGWIDPVVHLMEGQTAVHRARCGDAAWLTLRLRDERTPNTMGVGAVVDVYVDGKRHRRWLGAGSTSMFTAMQPEVHVGLGDVEIVDRIEVLWPDGQVTVRDGVPTRRHLTLVRRVR